MPLASPQRSAPPSTAVPGPTAAATPPRDTCPERAYAVIRNPIGYGSVSFRTCVELNHDQ